MVVVSDTSVISGLLIIDRLSLLKELFNEVVIPVAVHRELLLLQEFGYETEKLSIVAEFRMSQTLIDLVLRTVNEK